MSGPDLELALRRIDDIHREDPTTVEPTEGAVPAESVPAELLYAERMSRRVEQLRPNPSVALQLAARAQHLERWKIPRSSYPEGKAGYHQWRIKQRKVHSERVASVLKDAGFDEAAIERVGSIIQKRNLGRDPEVQALEDAACWVFLEHEFDDFSEGRKDAQLVDILQKTLKKMSSEGIAAAQATTLSERATELLALAASPQSS